MRENRTYGSEGGEAKGLPYPYRASWSKETSMTAYLISLSWAGLIAIAVWEGLS